MDAGDASPEVAIDALREAFRLLQWASPLHYKRVRHEVARYVLRDTGFPRYLSGPRCVVLGKAPLAEANNGQLALVLVHEATHAKLFRLGIRVRRFGLERIELACLRQELALATRFPDAERWISFVQSKIESGFWRKEALRRRVERDLLDRSFPPWLARRLADVATRHSPRLSSKPDQPQGSA